MWLAMLLALITLRIASAQSPQELLQRTAEAIPVEE
jgi:hypothetical protein